MKLDSTMSLENTIKLILKKIEDWGEDVILMLPNFVVAIIVIVLFFVLSRIVKKSLSKGLDHLSSRTAVNRLAVNLTGLAGVCLGLVVALNVLHLQQAVFSLLAGVGVLGLALGFAFQDIAANFMSGIIVLLQRPFTVGDIIETKGYMGKVNTIDLRTTGIMSWNGQIVVIPNKDVIQNPLINYSKTGKRRLDIPLGISYGENLEEVERIAIAAVEKLDDRDLHKDIEFFYEGFGDSAINFSLRIWLEYPEPNSFLLSRHRAIKLVKSAFDKEGISIPFPIRTIDFGIKGGESLAELAPKLGLDGGRVND